MTFQIPQKFYIVTNSFLNAFRKQESYFLQGFYGLFYPGFQLAPLPTVTLEDWNEDECQNKEINDHILWGVPKSRRSVEKRRCRRIGSFTGFCKLYPIKKLLTCLVCSHPYEVGLLCQLKEDEVLKALCGVREVLLVITMGPKALATRVTQSIKDAMKTADGRDPIKHEYKVVFGDEKLHSEDGFFEGKRILEVPEKRPSWFAKKLTRKTNPTLSNETTVSLPNPLNVKK